MIKVKNVNKYLNGKFNKLSKAEKRVEIAKDVIAQIKAKVIRAFPGQWVNFRNDSNIVKADKNKSLKDIILDKGLNQSCNCCGLGAAMLSCTLYNNNVTVEDYRNRNAYDIFDLETYGNRNIKTAGLFSIFTRKQIMMIEIAFEQGEGYYPNSFEEESISSNNEEKCIKFGQKFLDDTERLIAIMENIIKNKGIFRP